MVCAHPSVSVCRTASFLFLFLCTVMLPAVTAHVGGQQDKSTKVYACKLTQPETAGKALLRTYAEMKHSKGPTKPHSTTSMPTAATNSPTPNLPRNYGMIIFRAFEMLDVFGPLDALQILSKVHKLNLYLLSDTLDIVTTQPATASMNPYNSSFVRIHISFVHLPRYCVPAILIKGLLSSPPFPQRIRSLLHQQISRY
jgi:hypothetical protein